MALAINRLDLAPWGSFDHRSLQFSGTRGTVELIDGPNAAGKSTIARAQIALLFGIPQQTDDAHTHPYQDLAIGAELRIDDSSLEVVRRKAKIGSLRDVDGNPLRDDPIPAALGGLSREIYTNFFHVDHETLVSGGEDLLQGKGEVGASLFAAAAGISSLHDRLGAFDQRADGIFRPRAHSTALMQELARLREHERRLNQSLVRPTAHRRMEQELEALQERSDQLLSEITSIGQRIGELERLLEVVELISEHTALAADRRELGEVPDLAPDAAQRRAAAEATLASERAQRDGHRTELVRLGVQLEALSLDDALLDHGPQIGELIEQVPVVQKAESDRGRIQLELAEAREELEAAARSVGIPAGALADLRRPDSARRQLDAVLAEGERLRERRDAADGRHRDALERHAGLAAASPETDAPMDLSGLEAAVRVARPRIGSENQLTQARRQHARREADASRALAALAPAPETPDALLALPPLPQDALAGLLARSQHGHEEAIQLTADRRQLADRQAEHAGLLAELHQHGPILSAVDLQALRQGRDGDWRGLRESLAAGTLPTPTAFDAFETSLRLADAAADELVRDAAGVELAKRVRVEAERLAARAGELDRRERAIEQTAAELTGDWAAVWARTGLAPIGLGQARDWQRSFEEARGAALAAREAADVVSDLAAALAGPHAGLRAQLAPHLPGGSAEESLAELVELAEGRIERLRAARDLGAAQAKLDAWDLAWPGSRQAAGLPEASRPDQAQALVRSIADGLGAQRRIDQLTSRSAGIDRDRAELAARLDELLAAVAPDLRGRDAWQAAAVLKDRLADQERRRDARADLLRRRQEAEIAAALAHAACERAEAELQRLCDVAGCASPEELPAIEARHRVAVELDRELRDRERRSAERGRESFETLIGRVAELDRDEAAQSIARLGDQRRLLEQERDARLEQIGQDKLRLTDSEHDTTAVIAAEDVEFSQARIAALARQYAIARLSASVIRRSIERYRDHNQNPLVARANELFGRFTQGTYAELFVDVDEKGRGCLVARRFDRVIHAMDQMSKGTREQLFLALRIAAIERYVELSGPVPVLFDDVFVESDDARCAQIFLALGELAQRTQVIVLTHHHHLVAIARASLGARLNLHELPAAQTSLRAAA
jgi:uncharacterized protein YhaN